MPTPAPTNYPARVGLWAGAAVAGIGLVYVLTGALWLVSGGLHAARPLEPPPAFLAVLEWLIILSVPPIVIVITAVHASAPAGRKIFSLIARAFVIAFAALTGGVHFVQMAVVRRLGTSMPAELQVLRLYPWPSAPLAIDFLAWDFFLGLAFIFAGRAFADNHERVPRLSMTVTGTLCLIGTLGPASDTMWLQYFGIAGYAAALPVTCALLALHFRRQTRDLVMGAGTSA